MLLPVSNPPNPWASERVEWLGEPPTAELQVYEETARSILTRNESPDIPFRWSLNPYRGCYHACAYCYARPTHHYWGFGAGTDFDRKIVVKTNAPSLLRKTFGRPSWSGELIALSGNTDCYQPLEASYRLTRRCLEVCAEARNPVTILTKSPLVRRDIDVLGRLARDASVHVSLSIAFADDATAHALEPTVAPPSARFATVAALAAAGVPVGVGVAPVIPGLNDADIPVLLERAKAAGATRAFITLLRLDETVRAVFEARLRTAFPDRAARVLNALADTRRPPATGEPRGSRMVGRGPRWDAIQQLFDLHCRRLGLSSGEGVATPATFRRPDHQLSLF